MHATPSFVPVKRSPTEPYPPQPQIQVLSSGRGAWEIETSFLVPCSTEHMEGYHILGSPTRCVHMCVGSTCDIIPPLPSWGLGVRVLSFLSNLLRQSGFLLWKGQAVPRNELFWNHWSKLCSRRFLPANSSPTEMPSWSLEVHVNHKTRQGLHLDHEAES